MIKTGMNLKILPVQHFSYRSIILRLLQDQCNGLYSFEIRTINNFIANIIYFISHIHIPLVFLSFLFQTWWTRCIRKMVNNSWSISHESSSKVYFHCLLRNNINFGCEKRNTTHWFQENLRNKVWYT